MAAAPANEVWSYGKQAEPILEKYLRLRYQLMPYIYSLGYKTWMTGAPIMRALPLDFSSDPKVADIRDEYIAGAGVLAAAITEQGAEKPRSLSARWSGLVQLDREKKKQAEKQLRWMRPSIPFRCLCAQDRLFRSAAWWRAHMKRRRSRVCAFTPARMARLHAVFPNLLGHFIQSM